MVGALGSRWSLQTLCGPQTWRSLVAPSLSRFHHRANSTIATKVAETGTNAFSLFSANTRSIVRADSWAELRRNAQAPLDKALSVLERVQSRRQADKDEVKQKTQNTSDSPLTWISAAYPSAGDVRSICQAFDVHPLTVEDILDRETRDKVEVFEDYRFISYSSFDNRAASPTYLEIRNTYLLLFPASSTLISFHFLPPFHVSQVEKRLTAHANDSDVLQARADWIAHALIDAITDSFKPAVKRIETDVQKIEDNLLSPLESDAASTTVMLHKIGSCRGDTLQIRRLLGEKREVLTTLRRRAQRDPSMPVPEIDLYLSDVQDHLTTMTQDLVHFEDSLSRAQSNCLINIQIQSTESNNRINNALSKLTVLGTILVPLNIITGVWGMNVRVPGQEDETLFWFAAITSSMACIAFGASIWARRFLRGEAKQSKGE